MRLICRTNQKGKYKQYPPNIGRLNAYNSHSASFGPSAVRVNAETVYSARREADLVMTSTGQVRYMI